MKGEQDQQSDWLENFANAMQLLAGVLLVIQGALWTNKSLWYCGQSNKHSMIVY